MRGMHEDESAEEQPRSLPDSLWREVNNQRARLLRSGNMATSCDDLSISDVFGNDVLTTATQREHLIHIATRALMLAEGLPR